MLSLKQYYELPVLSDDDRLKQHRKIISLILDNPDKFKYDIEEMIDYFITELGNGDFIRLYDKVMEKK